MNMEQPQAKKRKTLRERRWQAQQDSINSINEQLQWTKRNIEQNEQCQENTATRNLFLKHRDFLLQTRQDIISSAMDPRVSLKITLKRIDSQDQEDENPRYEIQPSQAPPKPPASPKPIQNPSDQDKPYSPTDPPTKEPLTTQMGRQTARMRNTLPPKKRPLTLDLTSAKEPPQKQVTTDTTVRDHTDHTDLTDHTNQTERSDQATKGDLANQETVSDHINQVIEQQLKRMNSVEMTREMFTKAWQFLRDNIENGAIDTEDNTGMPKDILDMVQTPVSMQQFFRNRRKQTDQNKKKTCFCGHETCNKTSHWIREVPKFNVRCRCGRVNCNLLGHNSAVEIAPEEDLPKSRWRFPTEEADKTNSAQWTIPRRNVPLNVPSGGMAAAPPHPSYGDTATHNPTLRRHQAAAHDHNRSIRVFGSNERLYPNKAFGNKIWSESIDPRHNKEMAKASMLGRQIRTLEERTGQHQAPYCLTGKKFQDIPQIRGERQVVGLPLGSQPYGEGNPPAVLPTNVTPAIHRKTDILVPAMYIPEDTYWIIRASKSATRPGKFCTTLWPLEAEQMIFHPRGGLNPTRVLHRK